MRTIVITGGAGFIGSNLCRYILDHSPYKVIAIDNLSHGSLSNLESCLPNPNFEFVQLDIFDISTSNVNVTPKDVIVHLAAGKIPRYSDALDTLKTNGMGSNAVFEFAAKNHLKTIAASTSDVYGKNPETPFSEKSDLVIGNPDVKRWSYAVSKMYEEQLLYAYSSRYGFPGALVRFFGAFGINQSLDWLGGPIPVFIEKAIKLEPIEVHGDGSQTRSFTFIDDHVIALFNLIELEWEGCDHFNLGSSQEISILTLAQRIWAQVNPHTSPKIEFLPYETFGKYEDVMRRVPDTSKAKSRLDLPESTNFDLALSKTIEWQKKFYVK
jgi:UDP-glucose 4-epimerase